MKRDPFTLVELLMIVVVLSILVAILMPTFRKAREYAREEICMNSIRQVALGYQSYMHDYDEEWPIVERWLDDFTPSRQYVKSLEVYTCPSTKTPDLESDAELVGGTDYLLCGDIQDVERNNNYNNGHGNNPYHFDPSNPSRPTQDVMDAKNIDDRIIYERNHGNHFARKFNVIFIKDLHYDPEVNGMARYWTLDDRGWIERSLDPWP